MSEYTLLPIEGELQPVGKMPTVTAEQVNVLAVIQSVSKVDVLANVEETANGIIALKASYLQILEKAKAEIANAKTKADFERAKDHRLSIRDKRLGFTKTIDAELAARKLIYDSAKKGKVKIEDAFKSLETELDDAEKPVDEKFKAAAAVKKALADAIAKLKAHAINPLLSTAEIETAIDDFRFSFGDTDYQESQSIAETIFEAKITEFETILAAAKQREENEERVRIGRAKDQQRANINVTFPLAEISDYSNRTATDIQARIDWTTKANMTVFDLVLTEAEAAKQSCLNMLNAFFPMAQAREAKEAADKAVAERLEREKQAEIDAENARLAQVESDRIAAEQAEIKRQQEVDEEQRKAQELAVVAIINDDVGFTEDVAKIIGESVVERDSHELSETALNGGSSEPTQDDYESWESEQSLEVIEVTNEPAQDDCVLIPVKHLKALICIAQQFDDDIYDSETLGAIKFAKSLI